MDRTASEINAPLITAIDAEDIFSATSAKVENATLECQQFFTNIALCYQCERVSAPIEFWTSTASTLLGHIIGNWIILTQSESTSKHLNQFCIWERLFEANDIVAFYHTEVQLRCWSITMRFKFWIVNLSNFGGRRQQSKQILQKNNSFFLFDHIAVLFTCYVLQRVYFLPSNSEFDLNG